MTIDVLPTLAHLIDGKLPRHKIDGLNIWPLIDGQPGATCPHDAYFFYRDYRLQAVRMGRWKMHFPHNYRTLGGRKGGTGGRRVKYEIDRVELSLFDLKNDKGQTTDVKDQHPQVVAKIKKLTKQMRKDLGDSGWKMDGSGRRPPGRLQPDDARFVIVNGRQTLVESQ
jgi:arylsulfatase A-like enzyme